MQVLNFDAFAIAAGKREERITGEEGGKVVETEVEKEGIIKTRGWENSGGGRGRERNEESENID